MISRRIRSIFILFMLILFLQSIRNIVFVTNDNSTSDIIVQSLFQLIMFFFLDKVDPFVPDDLRHIIRKSSFTYTINDLLNITNFTSTFQTISSTSIDNSIHLLTQWYHETNIRRRQELISVLYMNVINNAITKIHFLQNSHSCSIFTDIQGFKLFPYELLKSKLIIHYDNTSDINNRLTIKQALNYANRFISTGYVVLINLDIFFDQSLFILKDRPLLDRQTILYLSRYEIDPSISTLGLQCSIAHYVGSHDALIFQSPIPNTVIKNLPFEIGTWHIEVRIIYEFLQENYTIRNVCKSIRIWHLHSSQVRHRLMPSKKHVPDKLLHQVMRYPEFL